MVDKDATITFKVAPNKMRVVASYTPPVGNGQRLTVEGVTAQLNAKRITTGILTDQIEQLSASDRPAPSIVIAEGIPPKQGQNARIEMYVKVNTSGHAVERENGGVDHYNLGNITSAEKGQVLYRKHPPTAGDSGKDVFGDEMPGLLGRDINITLGQGTSFDEADPNLVRATAEGEVLLVKGILHVSELHHIHGDVDFTTGNVRFKGSVRIDGTVKAGFEVQAGGTIDIRGNVEDATVIGGGDVQILGGFAGSGQGIVKAAQDVIVKFVENQRIEAERDIHINGESFHAELIAGRTISAKSGKGMIVGGKAEARVSVEASYFGSVACTPTIIKIGIDPRTAEKLKAIDDELAQAQEQGKKLEQSVVFLYKQKIDGKGFLPADKTALLEKLERAKNDLPGRIETLTREKEALQRTREDTEKAFASAEHGVHPKVQVFIGNQWITVEDTLGPSRFQLVGSDVVRLSK